MKYKLISISIGILFGIFMFTIIGSAMNLITIPWLKFNAQIQTNRDIVTKTYNAENAITQYHWFKERYEAIKATENKIVIAKDQVTVFENSAGVRKDWTFEDKNEHARLQSVVQGLKSHYEDIVAEYNAKAKETDRAIFKDELPLFFSIKPF